MSDSKSLTINDIAKELGVSPSTVSRAISGKGRIGEDTKQRILKFISEKDFHPNAMAQSLANSKTNNIAIIMPDIKTLEDMPFFNMCLYGVFEMAEARGYDLMMVTSDGIDTKYLDRLIRNHKVDGMIATRTYVDGRLTSYLKDNKVPFVAIGRVDDEDVIQIDHDHKSACQELTDILLMKGISNIAYLGGYMDQWVNRARLSGFLAAYMSKSIPLNKSLVFEDLNSKSNIEAAVDNVLEAGAECIICQDDYFCNAVLKRLSELNVLVPGDIKIASCYDSTILSDNQVSITALKFDIIELGRQASKLLIDMMEETSVVETRKLLDYQVTLKESTK